MISADAEVYWWLTHDQQTHRTLRDAPEANVVTSSGRKAWRQSWGELGLPYLGDQIIDEKWPGEYTIRRQELDFLKNALPLARKVRLIV